MMKKVKNRYNALDKHLSTAESFTGHWTCRCEVYKSIDPKKKKSGCTTGNTVS